MLTKEGGELAPSTRRQNHIDAISGLFIDQVYYCIKLIRSLLLSN